jgi:hypothetical protein
MVLSTNEKLIILRAIGMEMSKEYKTYASGQKDDIITYLNRALEIARTLEAKLDGTLT